VERLEERALLATLPPAIVSGQTTIFSGGQFTTAPNNAVSPTVAVDPTNPLNLVAVWTDHQVVPGGMPPDVVQVAGAFSTNGGVSWSSFLVPGNIADPSTSNPVKPYTYQTNGSVAFDRNGNFYVVDLQGNVTSGVSPNGAIVINKYAFGSTTPTIGNEVLDQWIGTDPATSPMLAVDDNPARYTDPTGAVVSDPNAGNVYVAWATAVTVNPAPSSPPPKLISIVASSDGGVSFSDRRTVVGLGQGAEPRLVVSQGAPERGVVPGQVSLTWSDFGGATATPPFSDVVANRIQDGAAAQSFSAAGGSISTGMTVPPGGAVFPFSQSVTVTDPKFTTLSNLTVTVNLTDTSDQTLSLTLVAPNGTQVPLVAQGQATGTNFGGPTTSGAFLGTTFDPEATRAIGGDQIAAPYIAHFRPVDEGAMLGLLGQKLTAAQGQASGTWQLIVTNTKTSDTGSLSNWTLHLTSGLDSQAPVTVAQTSIIGSLTSPYPLKTPAAPDTGVGIDASIASDNTLGPFSPYQGRLYVVYTDHRPLILVGGGSDVNPPENTDVFLAYSDNGGASWSVPQIVNDDNAQTDGYSQSSPRDPFQADGQLSGRAQFEPSVAVDQSTGTVVVSYLDARHDAADARTAMTIQASVDGGQTFNASVYANPSQTAVDAITGDAFTGQIVVLGPLPDNVSAGNPNKDPLGYGLGVHQGLAVAAGHVYPVWASNFNQGNATTDRLPVGIVTAQVAIAAGPRIVASTMGPVGQPGDTINVDRAPDGTPLADAFVITFDRPVDDSATALAALKAGIVVIHRDTTTPQTAPGDVLTVTSVAAVDPGPFGATTFLVKFDPSPLAAPGKTFIGTYSYEVSPVIGDRIRTADAAGHVVTNGNLMDQAADALPGSTPYQAPQPTAGGVSFSQDTLPLIVPGPHVATTFVPGVAKTPDNLVTNATVAAIDVVFDRNMNPASFTPADVLRIMGPAGLVAGPFTITPNPNGNDPDPNHPRTFQVGFPAQELSGTYTLTLASSITDANGNALDEDLNAGVAVLRGFDPNGTTTPITTANNTATPIVAGPGGVSTSTITIGDNFLVEGATLQLNITYPTDTDLEAYLITPTNKTITLFKNVGGTGGAQGFFNTVFSDTATTPIENGGRPFFGTFNPMTPLSVMLNDPSAGTYTLKIVNDGTTAATGTLTNWSLTLTKPVPGTGLGEPVADQAPLSFRIFTMDPTNPLSSNMWTAVGPAAIGTVTGGGGEGGTSGSSGRIGGLAVDPSDPSGNTVYAGGASGGIWKTTNFLNPGGPTWIPLTDFGPTFAINIGGIAVFPRNNDPNQSILFAATGEGDTGSRGVGFLRSMDGGATWQLLDSTDNTLPEAQRDHQFINNGGTTSYKIVVDPRLTPDGQVIVYAALGGNGPNAGIWRSLDSGLHWQQMLAGDATDVVLDPNSGTGAPGGNLQIVYAAIAGTGVFASPNRGQVWNQMLGGVGDPLIQDLSTGLGNNPVPVAQPVSGSPGAGQGRIVLAKPFLTGNPVEDLQYEGWLYALVVSPPTPPAVPGTLNGLYLTKDFGQNWTQVALKTIPSITVSGATFSFAVPTNNPNLQSYELFAGPPGSGFEGGQGNYDVSIGIDPTNPNVVYLGGTHDGTASGFLRVDTTGIYDPHALVPFTNNAPDGGTLEALSTGRLSVDDPINLPLPFPYLNLIRNPFDPFNASATIKVINSARFNNTGADVKWIPFDTAIPGTGQIPLAGTDQHRMVTMVDPLTGHARLIIGDDQGVFTVVDHNGTFDTGIGTAPAPFGSRNGNLQITQFYYGAAQPNNLAAQIAGAMFYGSAQDNGGPHSDPNIINDPTQPGYGDLVWNGPGGDATGVATDQAQGADLGTLYQYWWGCCGGNHTNVFQVDGTGRTFGLFQQSNPGPTPDPQWPFEGGSNFAVNPLNGDQIAMSSQAGRIFGTETQGRFWNVIGDPAFLDGSYAPAITYAAPDPGAPGGIGNLDNFIYVGTSAGHIFVTRTGGGALGNQWTNISAGLDGSAVQGIVADPTRGSHDVYAVTLAGVYFMADSTVANPSWVKITGNLFNLIQAPFGTIGSGAATSPEASYLTSIVADWRYVIPDSFANPTGPTHPMLYVGGEAGVYRSLDKGQTWTFFPDSADDATGNSLGASLLNAPLHNGGLPVAHITDLVLSLGAVDPTTGRPQVQGGQNALLASTYGRGAFAIRLAPIVFPASLALDPRLPAPTGSITGPAGPPPITNVLNPYIDGFSEQSAYGNVVTINLLDETPGSPTFGQVIGTGQTDPNGHFVVQQTTPFTTDGTKVVGVQATDQSGTKGNLGTVTYILQHYNPPPAPTKVFLQSTPTNDTGISDTDQITNVKNGPVFEVDGTVANDTVLLYREPASDTNPADLQLVGKLVAAGTTTLVPDTLLGTVPDGKYTYVARMEDQATNLGPTTANLSAVVIDTVPPPQPATPQLDPADDSGRVGDGITNVNQPRFQGTLTLESTDPTAFVVLSDPTGRVMGTGAADPTTGAYTIKLASPLPDGAYSVFAQAEDVAGNLSPKSAAGFALTILTRTPTTPTVALLPADDSGVKGDDITNVRQPHLFGTTDPGLTVNLIDQFGDVSGTPGKVLNTTIADGSGNYLIQFPAPLADGTYRVEVQAMDKAGNTAMAPFSLRILATPPTEVPTLNLTPATDTGIKGDGITADHRPSLTGVVGTALVGGSVTITTMTGAFIQNGPVAPDGTYTIQMPSDLNDGTIVLVARATDVAGNLGPPSAPFTLRIVSVAGDYNGDGVADLPVFRPTTATWYIALSGGGGVAAPQFGIPGDVPLQGDYFGDGKTDLAVFRPSTATWYILEPGVRAEVVQFGAPNLDIPVPGNYFGDSQTDLAVYRPTTGQWFIVSATRGFQTIQFGAPGMDVPVPAAYDGPGTTEIAVFRPPTGEWFIIGPNGPRVQQFGAFGDLPVPADYDGDGKADIAVFRPSTATWYILGTASGAHAIQFGAAGDIPVPADYDGGGVDDVAVYRPSTGQWLSFSPFTGPRVVQFGAPDLDIPVPAPYEFRAPDSFVAQALGLGLGIQVAGGPSAGTFRAASLDFGRQASSLAAAPAAIAPTAAAPAVVVPASGPVAPAATPATRRPVVVAQRAERPIELPRALRHHRRQDLLLEAALEGLGPFGRRAAHRPL
jgi:subtilisin-like proprotein convertase family protein